MAKAAQTGRDGDWTLARSVLLAALIVAAIQVLLLFTSNNGVLHGTLFDPDCYMHLARALRLMTLGSDGWDPRINAPYGYDIHWTVLFDGLLAAGAEPLRWFGFSQRDALYIWGSAISPLLLMMSLAVLAWGVKPWLRGLAFLWLVVLVFTQPQFSAAFIAGRPDHHSLVLGLLLAQFALVYALLDGRAGMGAALLAGVLAGLQIATSVEGLLTVLVIVTALGLSWAILRRTMMAPLAAYLTACVATMTLWLVVERGANIFQPHYDRISIVHVAALGFLGVAAFVLAKMRPGESVTARLAALSISGGLVAALTAALFPDFFLGPWPHLSPAVKAWHKEVTELQPMLSVDARHAAQFLSQLAAPLLSLPLMLHHLRRGEAGLKAAMLLSLCGLMIFGALALAQMRWSAEVQAAMLLPWTLTTLAIMKSSLALKLGQRRLPLRSAALAAALLLQIVPALLFPVRALALPSRANIEATTCAWDDATKALTPLARNSIVLTQLWYGPQILWRTQLRVIGGPYEIAPALEDSHTALDGSEPASRAVVMRRGINFILVCGAQKGFAGQLARGDAPGWLTPTPFGVPGFRLYRVRL